MNALHAIAQRLSIARLSPQVEAQLRLGQYQLVCSSMRPSILAMPAFCAGVCLILHSWISTPALLVWWIAVAFASLGNGLPYLMQAHAQVDAHNVGRWINFRAVMGLIHNIVWVLPGFFFWPYCSELGQLLLILIYACTLSGGIALVAPCPRWALALAAPLAITLILAPTTNGTWMFDAIALLFAGYSAFMAHLGHALYSVARNALLFREQNAALLLQLSQEKDKSDAARAVAEAANRSKSHFLANMSHELRTPLNAVLGFSEMIGKRVWGDDAMDRYVDYADSIHASGTHLLQLINDILDLAKIEAGKFEIQEERVELIAVARQALRLVETQGRQKGVRALLDASADVWMIGDERAMRQVLTNLLSNAVKFTPKGGTIAVIVNQREGEGITLTVRDSGVGIRPEDMARVMEAFGQGKHEKGTTAERGTGLGLPIVKGLVEAHGGTIRIESKLGAGTSVVVSLPESRVTTAYRETELSKIA